MTTEHVTYDFWLYETCGNGGEHVACQKAYREGRPVHIIPVSVPGEKPSLVLPNYHFATREEAIGALREAERLAPTVGCDADLYIFRQQGIAHKLPVGWIDPTRR